MKRILVPILSASIAGLCLCACSTEPKTVEQKASLSSDAQASLSGFRQTDSGLQAELDRAAGYAVLPDVGRGAVIVGGTYGRGEVYEHGMLIGYCDVTEGTVGLALGGQSYSELIIFRDEAALDKFKRGQLNFEANASAVAIKQGSAAATNYRDGVAVFIHTKGGLMADASVGGQKLRFKPL